MDLLCEVIRKLTNAEKIEFGVSRFNDTVDIKVVNELVALQAVNPHLIFIDLWLAGNKYTKQLSNAALEQVSVLRSKGVEVRL